GRDDDLALHAAALEPCVRLADLLQRVDVVDDRAQLAPVRHAGELGEQVAARMTEEEPDAARAVHPGEQDPAEAADRSIQVECDGYHAPAWRQSPPEGAQV